MNRYSTTNIKTSGAYTNGTSGVHTNGLYSNGEHTNGTNVNGNHVNGVHLNGVSTNGVHTNGVHINGVQTNGVCNKRLNGHSTKIPLLEGQRGKRGLVDIIAAGKKMVWNKKSNDLQSVKFRKLIEEKYNLKFNTFFDFHEWTVENYDKFWAEVWHFYDVIYSKPYDQVVKVGRNILDVEWFPGARLNYAENLLRFRDDHVALLCVDELGREERVTYEEMYNQVTIYAAALRKNGLQLGDRVTCYMPNRKEAIFAMLAATSMGAIFGGPLPFYGPKAATAIVKIMRPTFLFSIDKMRFDGVESNLLNNLPDIVEGMEDVLKKVIIIPSAKGTSKKDISGIRNGCFLAEFLKDGRHLDGTVPELEFEQLPANYPVSINFTSGTTGVPKGIVHSAAGLVSVIRDFGLQLNFGRDDVLLSMHPVGWNLWNLFATELFLGSTLLLYDGLPCFLTEPLVPFWDFVEKYKVSFVFFVTSIVDAMEKRNLVPRPGCNLDHLKVVTIGASPVKLQNIDFFLQKVKKDLLVGCLYGATESMGTFSGFDLNSPIYSAEIQTAGLGLGIKCFDSSGKSVVGEIGELVVTKPCPSLPTSIWNDSKKRTLEEIYLAKYPGIFTPNDEVWIDPETKGFVIIGRSDDIIKQFGERFSAQVIYWALHEISEIEDMLCVAQDNNNGDQRAVLFVKVKDGLPLSEDLLHKITESIEGELTAFHVPDVILEIEDIPYNLNGKKMEKLVRTIIATNEVPEVMNVRNPECLSSFCNIPELQNY